MESFTLLLKTFISILRIISQARVSENRWPARPEKLTEVTEVWNMGYGDPSIGETMML